MAGVARPSGTLVQIGLVALLRLRIARNSLGSFGAKVDLIAKILVALLAAVVVGSIGLGLGAGAYAAVKKNNAGLLAVMVWIVFLAWQFLPVLVSVSIASFDFRSLLRFPLRFSTFYLLSLIYGLFDPVALSAVFWLACIGAGATLAGAGMLPWLALVLSLIGATSLLLNRLVFSWLEKLLARRRTREIILVVFIFGMLSLQLFGAAGERWSKELRIYVPKAAPVAQALPPGLAGKALAQAMRADPHGALLSTFLLGLYAAGLAYALRFRLRAQYRGEELSEAEAPPVAAPTQQEVAAASSSASFASFTSFLPGPVAALVEKELRYLSRNWPIVLNLAVPLFLIVLFSLTWDSPRAKTPGFFKRSPELMFPSAVAYALLIIAPMVHNTFAFDGPGIQLLFMAPVRFRDVLMAKNIVYALMLFFEAAMIFVLLTVVAGLQNPMIAAATFLALLFAALCHFMVGNVLSLYYPRRFDFGSFKQRQSGMAVLLGLLVQIVVLGMIAGIFFVVRAFGQPWMALAAFAGLAAAALQVYFRVLDYAGQAAIKQREVLTAELCKT